MLLGGDFKHVLYLPLFGEMIQFEEPIFEMGSTIDVDFFTGVHQRKTIPSEGPRATSRSFFMGWDFCQS